MKQSITYFMWGYQQHFRVTLQSQAKRVLKEIAPDLNPEALLVGVHVSDGRGFDVCVEPEDGKWPLDLFSDLKVRIDELYAAHPRQGMFCTPTALRWTGCLARCGQMPFAMRFRNE